MRHGNLHRAAEELGITQPALSKSIRTLEDQLDSQVLIRSSRGVEPTPLGKALSTHAGVILSELRAAEATAKHYRGGSRRSLRMGAGPTFCDWLLPAAIGEFRRRYPTTRLRVTVERADTLQQRLQAGEIDFYIGRVDGATREGSRREVLYVDRLAVFCRPGHPLNTGRPVEVEQLADYEWAFIASHDLGLQQPLLLRAFIERGLDPPKTALETESTTLLYALARNSDVLCLRPMVVDRKIGSIGGLVELPVPPIFPDITRAVIYRESGELASTDLAMLGILREIASGKTELRSPGDAALQDPG